MLGPHELIIVGVAIVGSVIMYGGGNALLSFLRGRRAKSTPKE